MAVDYTPTLKPYEKVGAFRYWCQTTLPLVYDDSKSYLELLYSVIHYLNSTISDVANMGDNIDALLEAYTQLQTYVNNYFDNLDVQEEINQKLDDMAASGDLDNLLEPFVQTFVEGWMEEHITPTSPVVDNSLTISGAAADALTVGRRAMLASGVFITSANVSQYPDCDTLENNRIYDVSPTAGIAHAPFTRRFTLINTGWNATSTHGYGGQLQIAIEVSTGKIKTRYSDGSAWSEWTLSDSTDTTLTVSGVPADALTVGRRALLSSNVFVTSSNVSQYPDCDTLENNSVFYISATAGIAHAPFTGTFALINTGWSDTQTHGYGGQVQIAIGVSTGNIKTRYNDGSAWSEWLLSDTVDTTLSESGVPADALTVGRRSLLSSNAFITSANVSSFPDCDTLENNRVYYISSTAHIAHAAFTGTFTLINTGWNATQTHGYGGQTQIAIEVSTGKIKARYNNGTSWSEWKISGNDVIISSPSTFINDIERAESNEGTAVYLTPGEYDLFSLKSEADWISDSINTRYCGIILKNGIRIIGRPGAVIKANYTGNNSAIKENFSIFNIAGDCEIDGVECEGTNICYIVHDDPRIVSANVNNAVIKNCKMTHLGTDHTFEFGAPICIGAGIANSTRRLYADNIVSATRTNPINIHSATNGKGYYIIKGNICLNGTIRLTSYGDGTGILEGTVRNNLCAEVPTKAADANIKVYMYQNEVIV